MKKKSRARRRATLNPTAAPSAGGKAEAAGSLYETLTAAWYTHRILLGKSTQPVLELPSGAQLTSLICQSDAPVDDVNAYTSDGGILFVQVKRTVSLSTRADSAFASAVDQFVHQYQGCASSAVARPWARRLDASRDRLVLVTRGASSAKITRVLPRLLRGIRDRADVLSLKDVATSSGEREVAAATEKCLRRSWRSAYGQTPTSPQLNVLLRLVWVQQLDLEAGERDKDFALDQLRINLLAEPSQSNAAFSELFKLCARLRAERSGTDQRSLMGVLSAAGIRLRALPDYRADIVALERWTLSRLQRAGRFTRLIESDEALTIDRTVWPAFYDEAAKGSLLLVGDPGAGKSGLTYRLSTQSRAAGIDVVFLQGDLLTADGLSAFKRDLGIDHDLADVLANWPSTAQGLLVIDALDAARKLETQTILREIVEQVLRIPNSRWRVVASVRKYDLRQGREWARMFSGTPPIPTNADPEFRRVRHVAVTGLTDDELIQVTSVWPALLTALQAAPEKLGALLRNIFNLHLMADLLRSGILESAVAGVRTQPELLSLYWQHRVHRGDGKHDVRELTLTTIASHMIAARSLQVIRSRVRANVDSDSLVDLEQNDILRAEDQGGVPNEDILLFSHHVLFDYAVARLIFGRGRDAPVLVQRLREQRELVFMLGPSLTLVLVEQWSVGGSRDAFWNLALALAREPGLIGLAQLAAPMVAAELSRDITDLSPVLAALKGTDALRGSAETFIQHLVGALFVRHNAGAPLVGPNAGPWMAFAERLADSASDRMMAMVRSLLAAATESL